jgi:hypothetical protein
MDRFYPFMLGISGTGKLARTTTLGISPGSELSCNYV